MKKLAILLAGILVILSVAGCGGTKKSSEGENGKITINWLAQCDAPVNEDSVIKKTIEEKFNVKLNFIYLDRNNMTQLLNVRISSGEIPDVMRVTDNVYRQYIDQGILSEIPLDLIKEVAPTVYEKTAEYGGENVWKYPLENGKNYAIPLLDLNGQYHNVPIWRDDWLKNVGIDKIPETLEEAEEAWYKFTNNDPDKNGRKDTYGLSSNGIKEVYYSHGVIRSSGWWALNGNGEPQLAFTLPESKAALTKLHQYYKDGIIDPEFITGENKGQSWANAVTFWNGRIGFSIPGAYYHVTPPIAEGSLGSVNYQQFNAIAGANGGTYQCGKPLVGPTGKYGAEYWGTFTSNYFVMGKDVEANSEKMKKILEICEWINSDFEAYMYIHYGIEGETYKVLEDGSISRLMENVKLATYGIGTNGVGYVNNNLEFCEKVVSEKAVEWNKANAQIANGSYHNLLPVSLPSEPEYKANITQKIDEAEIAFITGTRPLSEWDAFMKELDEAGLAILTKEAKEWYAANK